MLPLETLFRELNDRAGRYVGGKVGWLTAGDTLTIVKELRE
jgi:hypothetical protein